MNNPAEILAKAREHIRRGWVQGALAVDSSGRDVRCTSADACRWCAAGALFATGATNKDPAFAALRGTLAAKLPFFTSIPSWNDTRGRTQEQVIAMFDEAIQYAEQHYG